jgi:hypothetical protein
MTNDFTEDWDDMEEEAERKDRNGGDVKVAKAKPRKR